MTNDVALDRIEQLEREKDAEIRRGMMWHDLAHELEAQCAAFRKVVEAAEKFKVAHKENDYAIVYGDEGIVMQADANLCAARASLFQALDTKEKTNG